MGKTEPMATGLLKGVQGPLALLGPELVRTLILTVGWSLWPVGLAVSPEGWAFWRARLLRIFPSPVCKVGPALGVWEGWGFGSGRLGMGGGAPAFASWVPGMGAQAVLAVAIGTGWGRPRVLADGAHPKATKEPLSCPQNPGSVPLPLSSLCLEKAQGGLSRVHLQIQPRRSFNPFREPVR